MKCQELMVGDFCRSGHGFPMQITNVGDDYAYATFEGNEGDTWEFDGELLYKVVNNGVYAYPTLTCEEGGELPIIEEVKD